MVAAVAFCLLDASVAEEPARKFLEELRNRQYFDMAVEYLDRLEDSPLLPSEMRGLVGYETAVTLIQSVLQTRDLDAREEQLLTAQRKLDEFINQHSDHELVNLARTKLGQVQVERAVIRRSRAAAADLSDDQNANLIAEAIALYDDARKIYEDGQSALRKQLESLPRRVDPAVDPEQAKLVHTLRDEYVRARFYAALVQFEKAIVAKPESQLGQSTLADAESRFASIAEDYRNRFEGIQAVYYRGRCNQALGNLKEAIGFYTEILDQQEEVLQHPGVRKLASQSLMYAIDCWTHDEQKKYDAAIEQGEQWLDGQRPDEQTDSDWIGFKLSLARAYLAKSETESGPARLKSISNARRLLNEIVKVRSSYQNAAQELFVSITKSRNNSDSESKRPQPKTYTEAVDAAREVRSEHQVAMATVKLLSSRLPSTDDENTRNEMQKRIDEANSQLESLRASEIELLSSALAMADEDVPAEQLHELRFFLCMYYYLQDDNYRASVLGEFLGRRYPDANFSRQATRIALVALVRLKDSDPEYDGQISERLRSVAQLLLERWPNTEAANSALDIMIQLAVRTKQFDEAESYLAQLPDDAAKRGDSELLIGQSIWSEYSRQKKQSAAATPSEELLAMKTRALELLTKGIERKRADGVSSALLQAELSLVSNYIEDQEYQRALELLNDKSGPQTLAKEGSILMEGLERRTFLLAIQAYIGALSESKNPELTLQGALESMEALREQLDGIPNGEQALIAEYVKLAQSLQQQIDDAPPASRNALAQGYEQLLSRVAEATNSPNTLAWTAESLAKLGKTLTEPNGKISTRGQSLFRRAIEIYKSVLTMDGVSAELQNMLRLRVAIGLRELGEFQSSIDEFVKLLSENESQVNVQIEAARTYQQWGDQGEKSAYKKAIMGDQLIPLKRRNLVWGWGKLSQALGRSASHRELFHECRYNLVLTRYKYAMKSGKTEKTKSLNYASNEIILTSRLYPEMGGAERKRQYNTLLKDIQRALGEDPKGLET